MARKATESYCIKCGRMYPVDYFYKSPNPHHINGVLPYCKDCCTDITHEYLKRHGNLESALWFMCSEVGVPFLIKVYDRLEEKLEKLKKEKGKRYNYFGNYLSTMHSMKQNSDDWVAFEDTDVGLGEVKVVKKREEALKESMVELQLDWGKQDEVEDYQMLEYRFSEYTDGLENMTVAQERLFRRLCLVELAIQKKTEKSENVKDEQAQMLNLMHVLKIDDFKVDKEMSTVERMLESQIAYMEEEEPAYHYRDLEKYCDFMSIGKYMYNHIMRPLKNVLIGSKEYELKYTKDDIAEPSEDEPDINIEELANE